MTQCRKIAKFYFGAFFFRAEMDRDGRCFHIYILTRVREKGTGRVLSLDENIDVDWFDEYWCKDNKAWIIKRISPEETIDVDI